MKKIIVIAAILGTTWGLAGCGSTPSDLDQIASLGNHAKDAMQEGNTSKLAGLMNPDCSGDFLGSVAAAKAFGVDLGEYMKSAASQLGDSVQKDKIIINGTTATTKDDPTSPFAEKVNGHWYIDCSDTGDSTAS